MNGERTVHIEEKQQMLFLYQTILVGIKVILVGLDDVQYQGTIEQTQITDFQYD